MAALWARYRETGDPAIRAQVLGELTGLVHHVARGIAARVGDAVAYDDLVGAGALGLVQAFGAFDPSKGATFVTYATTRIRGAMLDELRAADWRPRSVRNRAREVEAAAASLRQVMGRAPREDEVANALGVDMATLVRWRREGQAGATVPLDASAAPEYGDAVPLAERLADPGAISPEDRLEAEERHAAVRRAIATLPEQQRIVLALCYDEELSLRQIAEVLHVTESRISQIRTAAIRALRAQLSETA
jgi:RNA polymerase sigma factor FliA